MVEKFLVRIDEEYPSDEQMDLRFVGSQSPSSEYKRRLDALIEKLDKLTSLLGPKEPAAPAVIRDSGAQAEVLNEMKEILSELNRTVKSVDGRYSNVYNALDRIEAKIAPVDTDRLKTALENALATFDRKFYEINDSVQDVRDKINKREAPNFDELKEMINDIYYRLENVSGGASANDVRNVVGDLMVQLETLSQKYDAVAQKIQEEQVNNEIMDRQIVTELETVRNKIDTKLAENNKELIENAVRAESEALQNTLVKELQETHDALTQQIGGYQDVVGKMNAIKKAVSSTGTKVNKSQASIEKTIRDFNSYLTRLNSVDYTLRLLQAKHLLRTNKKLPKWAKDKKKVLNRAIEGLEEEVIDILIVNVIPREGMTLSTLAKFVNRTNKKVADRIKVLLANNQIEAKKTGKKTVYVLKK